MSAPASAAASAAVRAPDASYAERLIDSDDDDVTEVQLPRVALSRLVDPKAAESFTCCAGGSECTDTVPTDLVTMGCSHVLCRACFVQMGAVAVDSEDDMPVGPRKCPKCRTAMPGYASCTNHGLMGQMAGLRVTCKDPRCKIIYELGHNFRGEISHQESVCLFARVDPCEDCHAPLVRGEEKNHPRVCPNRGKECEQCGERVRLADAESHRADGDHEGVCVGMIKCPFFCQPTRKQPRTEDLSVRNDEEITYVRPSELENHRLICPCRPVSCPFGGECDDEPIQAHELRKHLSRRKFHGIHMDALLTARNADRDAFKAREAALEAQIHALNPQRQVNPLPGYTRLHHSVMHLPANACTDKKWSWPKGAPINQIEIPMGMVPGVSRIRLNVTEETDPTASKRNKRSRAALAAAVDSNVRPPGRMLNVSLDFVPDARADEEIMLDVHQRKMGLVVSVLRAVRPTDSNAFMGACVDAGVHLLRTVHEFTVYANIARPGFDTFECMALAGLPDESGARSTGFPAHYFIGFELFERFEA